MILQIVPQKKKKEVDLNCLTVHDNKNQYNDSSIKFEQQNILLKDNTFTDVTKEKKVKCDQIQQVTLIKK